MSGAHSHGHGHLGSQLLGMDNRSQQQGEKDENRFHEGREFRNGAGEARTEEF